MILQVIANAPENLKIKIEKNLISLILHKEAQYLMFSIQSIDMQNK